MTNPPVANQPVLYAEQIPGLRWPFLIPIAMLFPIPIAALPILRWLNAPPFFGFALILGTILAIIAIAFVGVQFLFIYKRTITVTDEMIDVTYSVGPLKIETSHRLAYVVEAEVCSRRLQQWVRIRTGVDPRLDRGWKPAEDFIPTRHPEQLKAMIDRASVIAASSRQVSPAPASFASYEEHIEVPRVWFELLASVLFVLYGLCILAVIVTERGFPQASSYLFSNESNIFDTVSDWSNWIWMFALALWGAWRLWNFTTSRTVRVTPDGVLYRHRRNHWCFYPIEDITGARDYTGSVTINRRFRFSTSISSNEPQDLLRAIQQAKIASITGNGSDAVVKHDLPQHQPWTEPRES